MCPANGNKVTAEQFLEKARKKFGDRFLYDLSDYQSQDKGKIRVYCREPDHFGEPHGWYHITPVQHLKGKGGCKDCMFSKGYLVRNKRDFVYWSNLFHDNKYDYSDFEYQGSKIKGLVKCMEI